MIVGICSVRNEELLIETTLRHILAQGVDRVLISDANSIDGTREAIARADLSGKVSLFTDDLPYCDQPVEMNRLAGYAAEWGADWVLPFDADEFPYAPNGGTIADALNAQPPNVCKVFLRVWNHLDWNRRETVPGSINGALNHCAPIWQRKVVFRWQRGAKLLIGQHGVSFEGPHTEGVLDLRELKYISVDHFKAKIRGQLDRLDPSLGFGYADHVRRFDGASDAEMEATWNEMSAVPTTHDPVPSTLKGLV